MAEQQLEPADFGEAPDSASDDETLASVDEEAPVAQTRPDYIRQGSQQRNN